MTPILIVCDLIVALFLLRLVMFRGVIAAHVASPGESEGQTNVERLLEIMSEFPNLGADISTLTQSNRRRYLPVVLNDKRLEGRLMYGTDYPLINTPLVTPLQYPFNLKLGQMWKIFRTKNFWDRDVKLKVALGTKRNVFEMSRELLGIKN